MPADFSNQLSSFLDKHSKLADADSEKIHNELLKIRDTSVAADHTKLAAFLQTLRILRPTLRSKTRIQKWWDLVIAPVVDGVGYKRVEIEHASGFVLDVLDHGAGEEKEDDRLSTSAWLANNLLRAYLQRTEMHDVEDEAKTTENQFVAKQLEGVLVSYGSKKPKVGLLQV